MNKKLHFSKKTLTVSVVAGMMALSAFSANAQLNVGSTAAPVTTLDVQGNAYVKNYLGVGTSSPTHGLDIRLNSQQPIHIANTTTNGTFVSFDNTIGGGRNYLAGSTGPGNAQGAGKFMVFDASSVYTPFIVDGASGFVGISNTSPAYSLDILSPNQTAINIKSNGTSGTFLGLDATSGGGHYWAVAATGSGNAQGAGKFMLYDGTNSTARLTCDANGGVGINTSTPNNTLSVNGSADNLSGSWGVFSDARIKTVESNFTDGLNIINQLRPIKFHYNNNAPFTSDKKQIGIVAQELEKIAPYMVTKSNAAGFSDLREVDNQAYVFLLINAVKQQQTEIEELNAQNAKLSAQLENQKKSNRAIGG